MSKVPCVMTSFSDLLESFWNRPHWEILPLNYYFFVVLIIPPGIDFEQKFFWTFFILPSGLGGKLGIRIKECIGFHLWIKPLRLAILLIAPRCFRFPSFSICPLNKDGSNCMTLPPRGLRWRLNTNLITYNSTKNSEVRVSREPQTY